MLGWLLQAGFAALTIAFIGCEVAVIPTPSVLSPTLGPIPTTTTYSPSPNAVSATSPPVSAVAITNAPEGGRVTIPFADSQTAVEQATAVVGGSIWIATRSHLVRVDPVSNQVIAAISVDHSSLIAGDGALWTVSPVGMAPGPARLTVSRVDLAKNAVVQTNFPEIQAAGLGALWATSQDRGLTRIDPATGKTIHRWPNIHGDVVEVGCGSLWIFGVGGENLARFDPAKGELGQLIDISQGVSPVHETSTGCYVVLGTAETALDEGGTVNLISQRGIDDWSPTLHARIQIAGDTFWTVTDVGAIQQIGNEGYAVSSPWQLPPDVLPMNPKFADWRLLSDGSDLRLLTASTLVHLLIASGP